jgi:hypothetical protein
VIDQLTDPQRVKSVFANDSIFDRFLFANDNSRTSDGSWRLRRKPRHRG